MILPPTRRPPPPRNGGVGGVPPPARENDGGWTSSSSQAAPFAAWVRRSYVHGTDRRVARHELQAQNIEGRGGR